ncbi:MAG: hypothetical protein Q9202_006289 [Teloschistes flavicans]
MLNLNSVHGYFKAVPVATAPCQSHRPGFLFRRCLIIARSQQNFKYKIISLLRHLREDPAKHVAERELVEESRPDKVSTSLRAMQLGESSSGLVRPHE